MKVELTLGKKLRAFRDAAQPKDYNVLPGRRRRVPGLRMEEVSESTGISRDVIARAETDKYSLNAATLTKLADFYRVTPTQREDLFLLAGLLAPTNGANGAETDDKIHPSIQAILEKLDPYPVFVMNHRWDIIGWNQAMTLVFGDFSQVPETERNIVYYMFAVQDARCLINDWEDHAQRVLAQFRLDYSKHLEDQVLNNLISRLRKKSSEFAEWWNVSIDVRKKTLIPKDLNHPDLGFLRFQQIGLRLDEFPNIIIGVYYPSDEETIEKIEIGLAKRTP